MTKVKEKSKKGKERITIDTLVKGLSDPLFLLQKKQTVRHVEFILEMIDYELSTKYKRIVTQKIEHRIKSPDSIARKLIKKGYEVSFENAIQKLNDIVGIRVVCLYSDDVYKIAELLKQQKDFIPVSYTHLDVYKRQLWCCSCCIDQCCCFSDNTSCCKDYT